MTSRVIFRLSELDEANLAFIFDALRERGGSYKDSYPTRTKAVREALAIAAAHFALNASDGEFVLSYFPLPSAPRGLANRQVPGLCDEVDPIGSFHSFGLSLALASRGDVG